MGGSANGMPLNSRTPDACGPVPSTMPLASVTRSAAKTPAAVEIATISAIGLFMKPYYNAGPSTHYRLREPSRPDSRPDGYPGWGFTLESLLVQCPRGPRPDGFL